MSSLVCNSEVITSINDSFRHIADDVHLCSFYETVPSRIGPLNVIVVDRGSSTLGYPKERYSPINADHRGVCKFDSPDDPNYRLLRNALSLTVETALSEGKSNEIERAF